MLGEAEGRFERNMRWKRRSWRKTYPLTIWNSARVRPCAISPAFPRPRLKDATAQTLHSSGTWVNTISLKMTCNTY